MAQSFESLIDGIRRHDPSVCGQTPPWILEIVLERAEDADSQVRSGGEALEIAEEFYLGACRFITDTPFMDDAAVLLERISQVREYHATVAAIREGLADIDAGKSKPLNQFLADFAIRHPPG